MIGCDGDEVRVRVVEKRGWLGSDEIGEHCRQQRGWSVEKNEIRSS